MTRSASEAEDLVQECWLRWQSSDLSAINNAEAWLVTTVSRMSIDVLRSARKKRETYIGPWLPEPLLSQSETPAELVSLADTLSFALLAILEQLSPKERAAFVLKEAFEFNHLEIGEVLGIETGASRKLLSRAKQKLDVSKASAESDVAEHEELFIAFAAASASGDLKQLLNLFSDDIRLVSDGGGKVLAALRPLHGKERIERFILRLLANTGDHHQFSLCTVNARSGLWITENEEPYACVSVGCHLGKINHIYVVRNPDKLKSAKPQNIV
ncbi:MAG: RNA polymerase sigma factor SigJ [Pseudomonadales bacterium]